MEIGTIGAGPFAQAFAKQALKAGHKVKLSNRRGLRSLREIVDQLGPGAKAVTKEEAAACEMVLLAVPWDNVPETLASLSGWNNQILIDAINPYHGGAGNFTPAEVGNFSPSQLVAAQAPGARVVKALNNLTVRNLEADPIVNGARRVAFVSADDDGAKKQVETLLGNFGYSVIDLGNLRLDEFVKLKPKDWMVLNAANSQVARCLIAIAKSRDLKVVGIVRRSALIPEIEELGVDFVGAESPELSKQIQFATDGKPITLGLDAVGGPATATIVSALSPGAHLVSYAWLSGLPIHVPQGDLIGKKLNIHGFWMYYEEYLPKIRASLAEAAKVVASHRLSLPFTATYKPSQIKEAIEHYERGGKVLLDFNY